MEKSQKNLNYYETTQQMSALKFKFDFHEWIDNKYA